MNKYWGMKAQLHPFLTTVLVGGEWYTSLLVTQAEAYNFTVESYCATMDMGGQSCGTASCRMFLCVVR